MVLDEFRMKENSKDREESSQTGNPHVDLGCASRYTMHLVKIGLFLKDIS